ncbi:MAG: hypothetical protein L3J08_06715 [Flavobacteriaceae bacterium]|nr:hypothetical protein [Flavobacteriaceae bacterium]
MKDLHKQNKQVKSVKQIRALIITNWLKNYNLREAQYFAGHRYVSSTEKHQQDDLESLHKTINTFHLFS